MNNNNLLSRMMYDSFDRVIYLELTSIIDRELLDMLDMELQLEYDLIVIDYE